jgi:phosphonate transport system substrate-binding protein
MRSRSWSFNEPLSQSGYGITRYHLVSIRETAGFFSEVIDAGFHEESIRMVADGRVDASAIDCQVLAVEMREHPEVTDNLKIIDSLGPSTIQPVAVSKRFDLGFRDAVAKILVKFHETERGREILDLGLVEKWVPVGASNYNDIRAMVDACEQVGFMTIR